MGSGASGELDAIGLDDLGAFVAVARAGGFREAARTGAASASALSGAVRRLEDRLGVRLLHRTTRSLAPTQAGAALLERLAPALGEVAAALAATADARERPAGLLKLNVPVSAARLVLPAILPGFLAAHPDVRVEVVAEDGFVDLPASGCDAGVRYDDRLAADVIAVPIGPRDLLSHACLVGRFASGALTGPWEFERAGEVVKVEVSGPLIVGVTAADLIVDMAAAGTGVVHLFEQWLAPRLADGALEPVLRDWRQPFPGPFLYYSGRRLPPPPLRAFVDWVRARA